MGFIVKPVKAGAAVTMDRLRKIYRQYNFVERFLDYFEEAVDRYGATGIPICLLGEVNINILRARQVS